MRRLDIIFRTALVLALLAYAGWLWETLRGRESWAAQSDAYSQHAAVGQKSHPNGMSRGAYLAKIGDCISCHSAQGGAPYAGGLPINAPFGTIYSTNITPDKEYGIGRYSPEDFTRALREGIARDGAHLYPAMPYPAFALASDEDIHALYDYFMREVAPVHAKPPETKLAFPFNQRWTLWFWDKAFMPGHRYEPQASHDPEWNRGAYLVQSFGHCSACHSPRGLAYEESGPASPSYLGGQVLDNWYVADLRSDKASGLGRWSEGDIAAFLKTGHGAGTAAFGSMTQVVENSTQYLSDEDLRAIAHYLKSLSAHRDDAGYTPGIIAPAGIHERPGAGFYAVSCAACHQPDGKGSLPGVPALAGNPAVLSQNPASLIRIVLEGGRTALTQTGPKPERMPAFKDKYTDEEIADMVSYIRQSWGNHASSVTPRDVSALRAKLKK